MWFFFILLFSCLLRRKCLQYFSFYLVFLLAMLCDGAKMRSTISRLFVGSFFFLSCCCCFFSDSRTHILEPLVWLVGPLFSHYSTEAHSLAATVIGMFWAFLLLVSLPFRAILKSAFCIIFRLSVSLRAVLVKFEIHFSGRWKKRKNFAEKWCYFIFR